MLKELLLGVYCFRNKINYHTLSTADKIQLHQHVLTNTSVRSTVLKQERTPHFMRYAKQLEKRYMGLIKATELMPAETDEKVYLNTVVSGPRYLNLPASTEKTNRLLRSIEGAVRNYLNPYIRSRRQCVQNYCASWSASL